MSKCLLIWNKIKDSVYFDFYIGTFVAIIVAILIIPGYLYLPDRFGFENSILENLQMFVLLLSCYFALTAKDKSNKKFFTFAFLILTILMIREVNCGRTIFFAKPGEVNEFYRWSEIKYGWLAHPIFGTYIAAVAIYFFKNKLFINMWNLIKLCKLPILSLVLTIIAIVTGIYGEEVLHNAVFEELAELLFYVSLASILFLYSRNKTPNKK